ncbi:UNVERIFIED_CONTAM: putative HD superfamily hydrolase involved in NAD metabolism [Acetivibrio alkalicellulosi]
MNREEIKLKLKECISEKRYIHSLNVMDTAIELALRYGQDEEKAAIAGLLHDCAKDIGIDEIFTICEKHKLNVNEVEMLQPKLLHGPVGAVVAMEEFNVHDEDILNAIRYHTLGRENMTILEKIVFIADYIEPGRDFIGIEEVREIAFEDLDKTMIISIDNIISHIIAKGVLIHPIAIDTRNDIIKKRMRQ